MTINAFPLTWPSGWKRTPAHQVKHGAFGKKVTGPNRGYAHHEDLTTNEAVKRVLLELQRMGIWRDDVVISTNIPVRLDGLPRGDAKRPKDHGAAVYWEDSGARRCIAVDQYSKVEDNLAAIAATLDAMRAIERHGGAAILERAFTGFTALPAPAAGKTWREVLGIVGTPIGQDLQHAYRRAASAVHPDKPEGSNDAMVAVNLAYEQAKKELGL